jgi:hypothetical protein
MRKGVLYERKDLLFLATCECFAGKVGKRLRIG